MTYKKVSVYKESDHKKVPHEVVPSSYPNREYFVCYGYVKWFKEMEYTKSVYIMARRWGIGNNGETWENFANAHILPEDIDNVLIAIKKVKDKFIS
jgi:hypothetical protein